MFDLENGTVMLNSGYEMPILGIGTFRLSGGEAENSVYWALRDGYRLSILPGFMEMKQMWDAAFRGRLRKDL